MMGFKSSFEKVLYSKNYRLYWNNEKPPSFTTNEAKKYLEIFLKIYKKNHCDCISCSSIIKINKNSIVVNKHFRMPLFIKEMLSLFDDVKRFVNAIDRGDKFMISAFI